SGFFLRLLQSSLPPAREIEHPVDTSAHHGNRGAHSVGHVGVFRPVNFGGAAQRAAQEDVTAANKDDVHGKAAGFHLIDGILDLSMNAIEHGGCEVVVERGNPLRIANGRLSSTYG